MAWVIENHFGTGDQPSKTFSIETFAWDDAGDLRHSTSIAIEKVTGGQMSATFRRPVRPVHTLVL
jgi:hypothetical protein